MTGWGWAVAGTPLATAWVRIKADADELIAVVNRAIEVIAARPTKRPGASSPGPQTTPDSSKAISSSPPEVQDLPAWPPVGRRVPPEAEEMVPVTSLAEVRDRLTA